MQATVAQVDVELRLLTERRRAAIATGNIDKARELDAAIQEALDRRLAARGGLYGFTE